MGSIDTPGGKQPKRKGDKRKKEKEKEERRRKKKKKATVYTIRIFFDGGTKCGANVHRH